MITQPPSQRAMAPHATGGLERRRSSSANPNPNGNWKFPRLSQDYAPDEFHDEALEDISEIPRDRTPKPLEHGLPNGLHSSERWPGRKSSRAQQWTALTNGAAGGSTRQGKQKSLSEAIKTVRTRKMSISETAHEVADSLKAPVSLKLVVRSPRRLSNLLTCADCIQGALQCVVCDFDLDQHLLQGHLNRPAETRDPDSCAIHAGLFLVPFSLLAGQA